VARGVPLRQLAQLIRSRYHVSSRVAYRLAHGLTQQQVADRWNELWPSADGQTAVTHKHISYWETWPLPTGRAPSVETLNRLARIYRTSAADLLDGEDHSEPDTTLVPTPRPAPAAPATLTAVRAEPADVLSRVDTFIAEAASTLVTRESAYHQLVKDLIEWACRMKRRDILQWLSWAAAAAAAAPVLDGLNQDEQQRTTTALATPSRVDDAVVDHIDAVLWRCMRQDDTLGPQAALDTTLAQRQLVRSLLPDAPSGLRDRLLSLYANLSRFAGWLSFDLSNYDAASDYYETARAAAHEAHNTELGAFVLCNMSHLATWRRQPRIGIDHALAAMGWAMQTDDARLQAYAYDVAARAFAMDGQEQAALNAVDQARKTLTSADDRPTTYVYFYGPGQLASSESTAYLYLGQASRGIHTAERALDGIDGSFVRNLAMASLRLGVCRLRADKPDVTGGAAAIADAARLAAHNRSARLMGQLRQSWHELEPWQGVAEVQAVREQLAAYGLA
jgi:tetratricopeptide (TPR) repeat protein/transcriptional regulator with XRE-family HTH domain